jgi:hypothetical protein
VVDDGTRTELLPDGQHVNLGESAGTPPRPTTDEAARDPSSVVAVLDSIPGAFEKASRGLQEIRAGNGVPVDEL